MSDETTTAAPPMALPRAGGPLEPALSVVWHPDPRLVGARLVLAEGAVATLGRGGDLFGPGVLDDRRLSRSHAALRRAGDQLTLRDLDSRNGTLVGGQRLDPQLEVTLAPGDVIDVGSLLLLVHRAPPLFEEPRHPVLLGRSAPLAQVLEQAQAVADRPTTVLLLGETGVGKELVARELHDQSGRRGPFVAVNCGSVADTLLQSELFGHARGAFSGAQTARKGLVAEAAGGTLFLDEIGDASPAMQVALLRLLQEREYRVVGENRPRQADCRFVAATHRPLADEVDAGTFRRDLFARLSRWIIPIPPLRERMEDLPLLAAAFATRHAGQPTRLSRALTWALLAYRWPGNVRELDGLIERLCVGQRGAPELEVPPWLPEVLRLDETEDDLPGRRPAPKPRIDRSPKPRPEPATLRELLIEAEGKVKLLAERLGIGRKTAYRWLAEADIDIDAVRREA